MCVCVSRPLTGAPVASVRVEEVRVESVGFGELLQVLADVAHLVREREREQQAMIPSRLPCYIVYYTCTNLVQIDRISCEFSEVLKLEVEGAKLSQHRAATGRPPPVLNGTSRGGGGGGGGGGES